MTDFTLPLKRGAALCLTAALLLTACGAAPSPPETRSHTFFALDTVVNLSGYGANTDAALQQAEQQIRTMEADWSRTLPDSQVSHLNQAHGQPVPADPELIRILTQAKQLAAATDGAFAITIAPIADLWGFAGDAFRVPTPDEIAQTLPRTHIEHLQIGPDTVQLTDGANIDLGGIAKGYALEQIRTIYEKQALPGGLANLGGDILAYGSRPDGSPWRIAIRDPDSGAGASPYLGTLYTENAYVLTSGSYERFFEADGKRYHHILDPKTGCPADSDLVSVTVVTPLEAGAGTAADALATALFVMGRDGAEAFWRSGTLPFEMILVDDAAQVWYTDGLAETFLPEKPDHYSYQLLPHTDAPTNK